MARSTAHLAGIAALTCASLTFAALPAQASPDAARPGPRRPATLVPIGGGYETPSLQAFAMRAAQQARGRTVDLVVVPSSYGDDPKDRVENLVLAGKRVTQLQSECATALAASAYRSRFTGCRATLATLLDRKDALDPANAAAFTNPETDGVYILGGDQELAMKVLANSPAEKAMEAAFRRGVVVGGTSAGNAVESRTMGAGYSPAGLPETGLQKGSALLFWGDDAASDQRGLSFGTRRVILDQHFYQRGRLGRLLAYVAASQERYGHGGKLGVGVDWATGLSIEDDARLAQPFGYSSSTVLDASSASAPRWVGPSSTLSVRGVRAHLVAPTRGGAMTYDTARRAVSVGGRAVRSARPAALPRMTSAATLVLGGGQNASAGSAALRQFASQLRPGRTAIVVVAGYADAATRDAAATAYRTALAGSGWTGSVRVVRYGVDAVSTVEIARSAGVLVAGGDQSRMAGFVADRRVRAGLWAVRARGLPLMTDGAATAVAGSTYVTNPDPAKGSEDDKAAIAMFRAGDAHLAAGLGLVRGYAFEPQVTQQFRWGRLFGIGSQRRGVVAAGVSERTGLVVDRTGGHVVGERSVVALDARRATWYPTTNGALAGANAFLSTFAVGDRVR